ncbi:MAG TPA: hypothetical protein VKG92_03100, partial [Flavobacteriales bacterium]|nr:hypothetical protein [Flavobacteriales bacterium]
MRHRPAINTAFTSLQVHKTVNPAVLVLDAPVNAVRAAAPRHKAANPEWARVLHWIDGELSDPRFSNYGYS